MSLLLPSESTINISSITLSVKQTSGKTVDHIMLETHPGNVQKEIPGELSPGDKHEEVFDPALELSAQDQLCVSMQYRSRWRGGKHTLRIPVKHGEIVKEARDDVHGKRTYLKLHRNIVVTIGVSRDLAVSETARDAPLPSTIVQTSHDGPLAPTTSEILRICPRFRLLIIGNSGVGKSTLIKTVFGVKEVDVSEASRGRAEIEREFVAADNGLFVLHDSVGLEAAEGNNLVKVKQFIADRRTKADLKDRLHAVWVCLAVPYAKARLLEAGMEEFLRDRKKILGDIPMVVVLTKLDLLDNGLMLDLRREGAVFKTIEEAKPLLETRRSTYLKEYCTQPLLRAAEGDVPHVAVSTRSGYSLEPTIPELVRTTTSEIERFIKADPSYAAVAERPSIERHAPLYIAGMAQRASIEAKVDLTIAIGKKRYWTNLGASFSFSADKVKEYLLVIHRDIIQVWNFIDPEMALHDDKFKEALLDTSGLGVHDIAGAQAVLGSVAPLLSALAPLINDAALIVVTLPIAGALTLAKLCYEIYQSARTIAKRFMAYITDLIYVMKILFILAPQGTVTARDVALALDVYTKSTYRNRVHLEVNEFSAGFAMLPGGREDVVEKIEVLIRRYNITDEDVSRLRGQIHVPPAAAVSENVSASS